MSHRLTLQLLIIAVFYGCGVLRITCEVVASFASTTTTFVSSYECIERQCNLSAKKAPAKVSGTKKQKKKSTPTIEYPSYQESTATINKPAELAGVVEDHRYEQFFYDEVTAKQLYQLVRQYKRPLLLCNPTLAVLAERDDQEYRLLDRDTRFNFLRGYEEFSLTEPHLIKDYEFDAVFIDPPFANVTPEQVARCLRLISAHECHLWIAYNSRREKQLLNAMNSLECPDLVPKWKLSYKEGVNFDTQDAIWLYGPK